MPTIANRALVTEACPLCGKPVYADEGYYSIDGSHWECHSKTIAEFNVDVEIIHKSSASKVIKQRRKRGEGAAAICVKHMIIQAIKDYYELEEVDSVTLYLNPPVWNQYRFDVQRFQGSALVDGKIKCVFGSWAGITELSKYSRLTLTPDGDHTFDLSPDIASRRSKKTSTPPPSLKTPHTP